MRIPSLAGFVHLLVQVGALTIKVAAVFADCLSTACWSAAVLSPAGLGRCCFCSVA